MNNKVSTLCEQKFSFFSTKERSETQSKFKSVTNTLARTLSICGLKSRVLKLSFLSLKVTVKSGLEFTLKLTEPLQRYLLTCLANFSLSGQIFLHWAVVTLKGLDEFQNKKSTGCLNANLYTSFCSSR